MYIPVPGAALAVNLLMDLFDLGVRLIKTICSWFGDNKESEKDKKRRKKLEKVVEKITEFQHALNAFIESIHVVEYPDGEPTENNENLGV